METGFRDRMRCASITCFELRRSPSGMPGSGDSGSLANSLEWRFLGIGARIQNSSRQQAFIDLFAS